MAPRVGLPARRAPGLLVLTALVISLLPGPSLSRQLHVAQQPELVPRKRRADLRSRRQVGDPNANNYGCNTGCDYSCNAVHDGDGSTKGGNCDEGCDFGCCLYCDQGCDSYGYLECDGCDQDSKWQSSIHDPCMKTTCTACTADRHDVHMCGSLSLCVCVVQCNPTCRPKNTHRLCVCWGLASSPCPRTAQVASAIHRACNIIMAYVNIYSAAGA